MESREWSGVMWAVVELGVRKLGTVNCDTLGSRIIEWGLLAYRESTLLPLKVKM